MINTFQPTKCLHLKRERNCIGQSNHVEWVQGTGNLEELAFLYIQQIHIHSLIIIYLPIYIYIYILIY